MFSIGLINIAKHRGKYEFEVSFSESINTAISFKIGTDKFYTIFSGGINYFLSIIEYAAGLGFGTNINWKKRWSNQIEIQAFRYQFRKEIHRQFSKQHNSADGSACRPVADLKNLSTVAITKKT